MATTDGSPVGAARDASRIKFEIESERTNLADAVEELRTGLHEATDVAGKLRAHLPVAAAAAAGAGVVLAGGIGATFRLVFRRGREGEPRAKLGRFSLTERR